MINRITSRLDYHSVIDNLGIIDSLGYRGEPSESEYFYQYEVGKDCIDEGWYDSCEKYEYSLYSAASLEMMRELNSIASELGRLRHELEYVTEPLKAKARKEEEAARPALITAEKEAEKAWLGCETDEWLLPREIPFLKASTLKNYSDKGFIRMKLNEHGRRTYNRQDVRKYILSKKNGSGK